MHKYQNTEEPDQTKDNQYKIRAYTILIQIVKDMETKNVKSLKNGEYIICQF